MARGGRLTYFGPLGHESADLVAYLRSHPGVAPLKPGFNPAGWMLEVTGGSMATAFRPADVDWPAAYAASGVKAAATARGDALAAAGAAAPAPAAAAAPAP
jgi:hypothetical protein